MKKKVKNQTSDGKDAITILKNDAKKLTQGRTTLKKGESIVNKNELSQMALDIVGGTASQQVLLKHFHDARRMGSRGQIEECLVILRWAVGNLNKESNKEKTDARIIASYMSSMTTIIKQLAEMDSLDEKVAYLVDAQLKATYRHISEVLCAEITDTQLRQRVIQRLTGEDTIETTALPAHVVIEPEIVDD